MTTAGWVLQKLKPRSLGCKWPHSNVNHSSAQPLFNNKLKKCFTYNWHLILTFHSLYCLLSMVLILLALESKHPEYYGVLVLPNASNKPLSIKTEAIKAVLSLSYLQLPSEQSHKNTELKPIYFYGAVLKICSNVRNTKTSMKQLRLFLLCHSGITSWMLRVNLDSQTITRNKVIFLFLPGLDILPYWMDGREGKWTQLFIYSLCMFNINEQDSKFSTGLLASALKFSNIVKWNQMHLNEFELISHKTLNSCAFCGYLVFTSNNWSQQSSDLEN